MVGIVTGNGLGLFNASQNLSGGFGSPQGGARVNVSTGNLVIQGLDRTQSGVGIDLTAVRTYNALGSVGGADGWFWNGERKVQLTGTLNSSGSSVIRTGADGHETVFSWNGSAYVSSEGEGAHDSLSWDSGNSQWVWTEGNSRASDRYDSTGRLVSLTDTSGNVQTFAYDGSGRLSSVTDSSGQAIVFVYDGSGRLERLDTRETTSGALTQRVYYGYDGSGRLSTVKTDLTPSDNSISDNVVYTTTYTYDSTSLRIASITQGDGTTVSFTYTLVGSDYRVASVTDAAGTTTFSYDTTNRVTTVTNGAGQAWEYSYDSSDRLLEVRTPAIGGQRQITTYTYDGDGNVSSVTDGLGRTVTYVYDSAGNLTLERDEAGNTVKRTYTATNQLQNEIRYTAVSTESGGVWTLPSDSTALVTRYVYDSNDRLRFTVSAEGRVSEYRYDACGQLTDEVGYTADLYSVGSLAPTDTLSLSSLTGWLPTTAAQTRSALHYDYRGNLDWRKDYAAVDGSGSGIADSGMTYTKYVYDQTGLLLQTIAVTGSGRTTETTQVSYGYDGAGRLQSEVSAAGTKTWAYDASARTTTISQTIGTASRTSVTTQDSVGRITSQVEAATSLTSRTTSYVYDDAGRLRMQEDAAGARSYLFYDAASRVVGRVDALGGVTETVYNEAGQITSEIRYATRVSTGSWLSGGVVTPTSLSAIRPSTHADDRTTAFGYDSVGRRTTITDAGGTVSTTTYDAAGRVLRVETGSSPVRTTRFFYDKDGKLIAQLDAEGYLVRHSYDAAGQLRQSLRYASITSSSLWASGTLSALEGSLANTTGLSSWFFYDAQGRQTGTVNEQQFVTATVYNDEARTQQTVRYLDAYTGTVTTSTAFSTITGALTGSDTVTTSTQFDTLGRVSTRTAADGTVTSYGYDAYNRLVQETAASGGSQARETHYRYDAYGQVVSKLWGEGATHLTGGMTESQIAAVHAQYGELYSYDVLGRRAQVTDRANHVTTYYYDDLGQLTHVINAAGGIVETSYSTFGQVSETRTYDNPFTDTGMTLGSLTGGLLGATLKSLVEGIRDATHDRRVQHTYNTRGLLTQRTDGEGWRTQYTYNAFGEVATQLREQSLNVFATDSTSYNLRGEVTGTVRDVGGLAVTTATAYDAFGRIVSRTNELGKTTTTAYTDAGRTVTETDPLSHTRSRTYDALGRVLTVTDSLGKVTTYAYDDVTRTTTVTTPEGVVTETVLSEHGQTLSVTDGNGHTTTYAYNRNGDLLTTEDAASTVVVTNAYDAESGLLETVTDALGGVVTFTYDALNRVATRTQATGSITVYAFDTHGSQVTVTEADGTAQERTTVYGYDENGRVLTATIDPSGLALKTTYTYDGEGRQLTVSKGTTASPAQQVTTFTYDKLGRITSQSENAPAVVMPTRDVLVPDTAQAVVADIDRYQVVSDNVASTSTPEGTDNFPTTVRLANGGFITAWTLGNGDSWRAQRHDNAGAKIGAEIVLNTVAGTGSTQRSRNVSIAELAGGGFVATWTNENDIYARRFAADGSALDATEQRVNTTTTDYSTDTYIQKSPAVAALQDGGYVIVWQSPKSANPYYQVMFQRFDAAGTRQDSEVLVDQASSSNSAESPEVTVLASGNFVVSYRVSIAGSPDPYAARIYSASGVAQGSQISLLTYNNDGVATIAGLSTGGFVVASKNSAASAISVRQFSASGAASGSAVTVANGQTGSFDVVAVGSGGYAVAWDITGGPTTGLHLQEFNASDAVVGAEYSAVRNVNASAMGISLASLSGGRIALVRNSIVSGSTSSCVRASVLGLTANIFSTGDSAQVISKTIRLANGGYLVAWTRAGLSGWSAQRYESDGDKDGSEFALNNTAGTAAAYANVDVSVTELSDGKLVATWTNNNDIYMRRFSSVGTALDATDQRVNTTLTDSLPWTQRNATVTALASGKFAVVWHSPQMPGFKVFLRIYASDGSTVVSETLVDQNLSDAEQGVLSVATLSNGNFVVSYKDDYSGTPKRYMARIYSVAGALQGSEFELHNVGDEATRLQALPAGGFVAIRVSADGTGYYVRAYDNSGTASGSGWTKALTVSSHHATGVFSIAAVSGGGYVLAYQAQRRDLSAVDVYLQRFDASHQPVGIPLKVASNAGGLMPAPSVAILTDGRIAVSWNNLDGDGYTLDTRMYEADTVAGATHEVRTQYKYDAAGRLTRTLDAKGNSSWNVYDDAGRVQYAVNALGDVTEYVYDNNNRVTSTVRYATRVATGSYGDVVTPAQVTPTADSARDARTWTIYDEDGRATVQVDALRQATRLTYDDAGNVIESRRLLAPLSTNTANWASELAANPAGISTHRAYDVLNRLRFEVDGKGQVSEWQYDDAGNVTAKLRYDDVLTGAASWSEAHIAAALTGETARKTLYLYNTAGQLTYEAVISGGVVAGAINGHVYDALGRVVGQRSFPAPVAGSAIAAGSVTLSALDAAWTATAAGDRRITHTILDQAGNARYTLNSLGYVLEQRFDALGRLTDTLQYRNDIDVGALSALDVATVGAAAEAANAAADTVVRTRIVRDVLGRERFVIDALGNVSEKIYDALGNVIEQRQYAPSSALSFGTYSESAVASAVSGLTGTQVQVTRFAYDQTGRLRFTLDALGYLSENRYDALGRTVEQIRYTASLASSVMTLPDLTSDDLSAQAADPVMSLRRGTRYIHDANGALHYSIDALGYVTEQVRDAHGRVLRETRYSTAVNLSGNPTEAQVASAITGLAGRSTHYRYDAVGNAELTVDALGYGTRRVFDAFGNVTSETRHAAVLTGGAAVSDSESLTTVAGRLTSDTLNRTTTWEYNALGQLVTQTSPAAEFIVTISSAPVAVLGVLKTRFTYDGFGNLETRSEGEVVGNRVDNNAAVTDTAEVRTSAFEYDLLGRQTASIAPGWYDTTDGKFYKDDRNAGESVAQTDRFQVRTEVQYDGFGNVAMQRVKTGLSTWATTRKVHDALNRLSFEIDVLDYVTRNTYDGYGNNTATTRYATKVTNLAPLSGYDFLTEAAMADGRLTVHADDRTLTMTYDALNRKTSVAQPTVAVYVYGGDSTSSSGGLIRVAESLDGAGTLHYANVTGSTTTGTPVVNWTYNAFGEQVKEIIAGGPTTFHYFDALGRKTAMVDGLGYYTAFEYFADTDKVKKQTEYATAVSLSGVTENSVPSAPSANGNDRTLQYTYNNLLQLTKTERLNATWWAANAGQTSYTQNTGTLTVGTVGYNAFGEAVQNTDAAGNATTMAYDGLGRVTQVTEPARRTARSGEGGIDPFWSVQNGGTTLYDNRLSASPVVMMAYDRFGQAVTQTRAAASGQAGLTQVTQTSYDHAGNVMALEDAAGGVKQFKVNAQGRTIEETQEVTQDYSEWSGLPSGAGTQTKRKTYAWDLLGRQTATTSHYMDGATAKETADIAEYNAFGEVSVKKINSTTLETYTYDKAGRVIQTVNANGTTHYHYDLAGWMTRSVGVGDGTNPDRVTVNVYDVLGRLTEQRLPKSLFNLSSSSDTATTLTDAIPLVKQQFDRWGNVTQRTDARGSVWKYTYNADNRNLTEESPQEMAITVTGATITMGQLKTARYDALGNVAMALDGKVETGTTTVALRSESFFYNTVGQLVKDIDATGIIREYAVDAHGNRVATKDGVGTVRYTDYDAMNRVIETGVLRTGLPGYGLAEPLKPSGSESQVAEAGSSPYINTVSTVVTGGYVVAWVDGQRIKGRLFDQSGQPSGSAFVISTVDASTSQLDIRVSLATLSTGGFVAVWQRGGDIYMRRFNADGSYVESAEVLVNTENTVDYSSNVQDMPSVATLADGSWVVVWQSPISTTSADVYLKRYSAGTGTSVNVIKSATKVNTTANSRNADVLALASGGYVISYSTASNILAQRYSASDTVSGSEFTMNTLGLSAVARPQLIMLSSGDFLAAWVRPNTSAIVVQAFTSTGTKVGSEVSIVQADWNSTLDGVFGLVALQDGGYAITYEVRNNSENRTFISRFDAAHYEVGARVELERLEGNPTPWLNYTRPSLLALDGDSLVALWGGSNLEGSYAPKIYARAFTAGNQAAYAAYGSEPSAVQVDGLTVTSGLTQVDSAAAGTNNHTRVIALANGGHLVAWTLNDGSGWYAQRYNADGTVNGSAFALNSVSGTGSSDRDLDVSIVELDDGNGTLVATWTNNNDIYARRFSASGTPLTTNGSTVEFIVNTTTTDYSSGAYIQKNPVVAALSGGGFVIAWQSPKSTTPDYKVFFQRYDSSGTAQGSETQVDQNVSGATAFDPQIVVMTSGEFVVAYHGYSSSLNMRQLNARRYSASGVLQGSTFTIEDLGLASYQWKIARLSTGGFVAVWQDGSTSLRVQRYTATGTNSGSETSVSLGLSGTLTSFGLTATNDGGYVVSYEFAPTGFSGKKLYMRRFNSSNAGVGGGMEVYSTAVSQGLLSSMATLASGAVVMGWDLGASSSEGSGIFTRKVLVETTDRTDFAHYYPTTGKFAIQSFLYDEAGQRYAEIRGDAAEYVDNRNGNVKYTRFDERGNVIQTRTESGVLKTYEYDEANLKKKEIDGNGKFLLWTYNAAAYNRLATHVDLAGRTTTYGYNVFGQLVTESTDDGNDGAVDADTKVYNPSTISGLNVVFATGTDPDLDDPVLYDLPSFVTTHTYHANGMLQSVATDYGRKTKAGGGIYYDIHKTERAYDASGNIVLEKNTRTAEITTSGTWNDGLQEVRYRLDSMGRVENAVSDSSQMTMFYDPNVNYTTANLNYITFYYDEFGNYRRMLASAWVSSGNTKTADDWYKYDLADRMVLADAAWSGGVMVANSSGGTEITYDEAGRRKTEEAWSNYTPSVIKTGGSSFGEFDLYKKKYFHYDDLGNLAMIEDSNNFRQLGQNTTAAPQTFNNEDNLRFYDADGVQRWMDNGWVGPKQINTFDAYGRLVAQSNFKLDESAKSNSRYSYQGDGQLVSQTDYLTSTANLGSRLLFDEKDMRDDAGNQLSYRYDAFKTSGQDLDYQQVYTTTFALFDGYKQIIETVSKNGITSGTGFGKTTFDYVGNGELVQAKSIGGNPFWRNYVSNRMGQMIARVHRISGDWKGQYYYYHDGKSLMNVGRVEPKVAFSLGFQSATSADLSNTPSSYVASVNDTAETVARAVYGDTSYAYLIADANGLASVDTAIADGTTVLIPNVLTNSYNAHDTVKPYNASDIIGNTTPVPKPPPPPKDKSGGFAQIVMVIVAVVATVLTAGAALGAVGSLSAAWSAGIGAMTTLSLSSVGAVALGSMVGSAVSQQVGDKWLGQGPVDWAAVGRAGVGSVLTAGFGVALGKIAQVAMKAPGVSWAVKAIDASEKAWGAVQGSVASTLSGYTTARLYGERPSFSWEAMAGNAIVSGITAGTLARYELDTAGPASLETLRNKMTTAGIAAVTEDKWFGGSRPNYAQLANSVVAQFMGDVVREGISTGLAARSAAATGVATGAEAVAASAPKTAPETIQAPVVDTSGVTASVGTASEPVVPKQIMVGREGARGYWGVAKSMLPAGASDADVQHLVLRLMTANPGKTVLHKGDVLNPPADQASEEAHGTYATMEDSRQSRVAQGVVDAEGGRSAGDSYDWQKLNEPVVWPKKTPGELLLSGLPSGDDIHDGIAAAGRTLENAFTGRFRWIMNGIHSGLGLKGSPYPEISGEGFSAGYDAGLREAGESRVGLLTAAHNLFGPGDGIPYSSGRPEVDPAASLPGYQEGRDSAAVDNVLAEAAAGGMLGRATAGAKVGVPDKVEFLNQTGGVRGSFSRTEGLGTHASIAELRASGALPGEQGVILTDRTVRFGDLYDLSAAQKVEFSLVTERVDGRLVKKLYSGDAWTSPVPRDVSSTRLIGHTHPNENSFQMWPSEGDMNTVNARYFRQLQLDPAARPTPTRIIFGSGDMDSTIFYPGFGKQP